MCWTNRANHHGQLKKYIVSKCRGTNSKKGPETPTSHSMCICKKTIKRLKENLKSNSFY